MPDEWRRKQVQKCGGGHVMLSLGFNSAEKIYSLEPIDKKTADRIYQEHCAMTKTEADYHEKHNLKDYRVVDEHLDDSLDLLAICRK